MILKKKHLDGSYIQVKVSDQASWPEAVDEFIHFLQGCGYIVQGYEIGDYISEQYSFQKKETQALVDAVSEEWQPRSEIKRKKGKKNA
ncbi:MAG: hypothetical protein EBR82_26005 [Caulobacteraceae bacterium]|nr:hypothetical protein [Caulobacteraceae bacterium]